MSYGNEQPIRESLLEQVLPAIHEYKDNHVVLEYDVQMQTWPVNVGTPNQVLVNAWCCVIVVSGALLGREHQLSYVWTFEHGPRLPTDLEVRQGVREVFRRLGIMRSRQLQEQAVNPDGPSPN